MSVAYAGAYHLGDGRRRRDRPCDAARVARTVHGAHSFGSALAAAVGDARKIQLLSLFLAYRFSSVVLWRIKAMRARLLRRDALAAVDRLSSLLVGPTFVAAARKLRNASTERIDEALCRSDGDLAWYRPALSRGRRLGVSRSAAVIAWARAGRVAVWAIARFVGCAPRAATPKPRTSTSMRSDGPWRWPRLSLSP